MVDSENYSHNSSVKITKVPSKCNIRRGTWKVEKCKSRKR